MTAGFQQQVYNQMAPAVAGDFASQNPYYTFDAGPGGLVAGDNCYVGRFAWVYPPLDINGTAQVADCVGNSSLVGGFIHREQQASIVDYLAFAGMKILPGQQMTLMIGGDFWCVNDGSAIATSGMKAFARNADGKVRFAAAGTIIGGASATGSDIAAASTSITAASINGNVMTVTATAGVIYAGSTLSGSGIVGSPKVVSQLTGSAGSTGTYLIDVLQPTAVASTTITAAYGVLTIGTATGTFEAGDVLTGTGVVAGTRVIANITGAGGSGGTQAVSDNTVVTSTTITASDAVETKWYARSSGAAAALVKISDKPLG